MKKNIYTSINSSGFTIVELLVVIVTIGILASITIVSYQGITAKANAATLISDLSNASKQLEMYKIDNGYFPTSITQTSNAYCPTPADVRYCIKTSSGNSFVYIRPTDQTFILDATRLNNTINYRVTNNSNPVAAAYSSTKYPSTIVDDASVGGAYVWSSPGSASLSDNVSADVSIGPSSAISHYLKATNFGFSIPTGATINGILLQIEGNTAMQGSIESSVRIVKSNGLFGTTNMSTAAVLTPTWPADSVNSIGGSTALWGESWTPADINSANFGAAISVLGRSQSIDQMRITVYYQ